MRNWLLQTLSDILNRNELTEVDSSRGESPHTVCMDNGREISAKQIAIRELKASREWFGAIAAVQKLLLSITNTSKPEEANCQGLVLSAPAPILCQKAVLNQFQTGIFTPEALSNLTLRPFQLPGSQKEEIKTTVAEFPLLPKDPIATEQFCLVFTAKFGLVIVLGEDRQGLPAFQFSFEPEIIQQCWLTLRSRLSLTNPHQLGWLDSLVEQFTPTIPDYRLVTEFSRELLKNLPDLPPLQREEIVSGSERRIKRQHGGASEETTVHKPEEVELLQALTHEIRTPLTTIRTLTKLLLKKRRQMTGDIIKRLELIDSECTEQINRMELIFQAAELQTKSWEYNGVQLTHMSLEQLFQQSIPRWQKQAQRRNVNLDFVLPKKLPKVVSHPAMLDRVLTGLMENFTRSLPTGGQIQVEVTTAGNQLKLQLVSHCSDRTNPLKSLGQLLMFQPETGSLCLNLDVTKNLFHALGGKLIVRQRPQQGEVFTIFLPLGSPQSQVDASSNIFNISHC